MEATQSQKSIPITSWDELTNKVTDLMRDRTWIFRGESSSYKPPLIPTAGRLPSVGRQHGYKLQDEIDALNLFRKEARPYFRHEPKTDWEWLAIAQHHGMHTRLLDWTESLLIAAYFATFYAGTKGDGLIYGIRGLKDVNEVKDKPFTIKTVKIYRPPHITPRIPAQRSVFTAHPNPTTAFTRNGLVVWRIKHNLCFQIKKILDACAINESSLFADLDGLSRYIGWRYKWGKF